MDKHNTRAAKRSSSLPTPPAVLLFSHLESQLYLIPLVIS